MVWLAGFALAFFVVALCFVSMGFLRTGLKEASSGPAGSSLSSTALPTTSGGQAAATQTAKPVADDDGIVVVSGSVKDLFGSLGRRPSVEAPEATALANSPAGAEIAAETAAKAQVLQRIVNGIVVPRLKPALTATRLSSATASGRPVPMPVDVNAVWLADNIRLGFAHERDFTGGKQPIFTKSEREAPLVDEPADENAIMLERGESLSMALARLDVRQIDREGAVAALAETMDIAGLKPGTEIRVTLQDPELTIFQEAAAYGQHDRTPQKALVDLEITVDAMRRAQVSRDAAGRFTAEIRVAETTSRYARVEGTINDSLFASAARAGMPHSVAAKLANMFLYDIDFQREIHAGDEFEAVYEVLYDEQGRIAGYGDVLFGKLSWRGGRDSRGYYRFDDEDGIAYFDDKGSSSRRLLMKTPIDGARITSGFGMRRHPVLGYTKGHKGTDFGASSGTPIMAAGDGVIQRANVFSTYGNYVRIKHAAGFETAYAHLKGFAPGIRAGSRVRQGDIIGYVGTTGRSTGPHLHYEVLKDGTQVNPMTIKVADGRKLADEMLDAFQEERAWVDAMRERSSRPATVLASR